MAQWLTDPTGNHEVAGSIPGLVGSGVVVSCDVGHRRGLDPTLLWRWHRPVAAAPIGPLAWEPPYAAGAALEKAKDQKKKKEKKKKEKKLTPKEIKIPQVGQAELGGHPRSSSSVMPP